MKAVVADKYGTPDVLQLQEVEKPTPAENEILIKVRATTVTPGDCRMRSFDVPRAFWLPGRLTLGITKPKQPIFGMELAGDVEVVGSAVTRFKPGDAVFACTLTHNFGAYAEYKCIPEDGIITHKPENLSYEEAAAVPLGALAALNFLKAGQIEPEKKILVYGASGSVGTYAVQLARHFGAHVTAVCSTRNVEWVTALGADVVIDYTQQDFTQNGETYDIIFDTVGKLSYGRCKDNLNPGGYYLDAVEPLADLKELWIRTTGKHIVGGTPVNKPEQMGFLKELLEAEAVRPVIDRHYTLADVAEGHRYVDTGRKQGNIVITV